MFCFLFYSELFIRTENTSLQSRRMVECETSEYIACKNCGQVNIFQHFQVLDNLFFMLREKGNFVLRILEEVQCFGKYDSCESYNAATKIITHLISQRPNHISAEGTKYLDCSLSIYLFFCLWTSIGHTQYITSVLTSLLHCRDGVRSWSSVALSAHASTWKTLWWHAETRRSANAIGGMSLASSFLPLTTSNTDDGWQRARMMTTMRRDEFKLCQIEKRLICYISNWMSHVVWIAHQSNAPYVDITTGLMMVMDCVSLSSYCNCSVSILLPF